MAKASRASRRERRKQEAERDALRQAERAQARRRQRILLAVVPLLGAGAAVGAYVGLESPALAGVALLVFAMAWLLVGLGYLGASVKPRTRGRAGSIDFGNR